MMIVNHDSQVSRKFQKPNFDRIISFECQRKINKRKSTWFQSHCKIRLNKVKFQSTSKLSSHRNEAPVRLYNGPVATSSQTLHFFFFFFSIVKRYTNPLSTGSGEGGKRERDKDDGSRNSFSHGRSATAHHPLPRRESSVYSRVRVSVSVARPPPRQIDRSSASNGAAFHRFSPGKRQNRSLGTCTQPPAPYRIERRPRFRWKRFRGSFDLGCGYTERVLRRINI